MIRLDIIDTALNLVTDLTSHLMELETRLASYLPLVNDEQQLHLQLNDLQDLEQHLKSIEKSIEELLRQSEQLANERFLRTSEQLAKRWKQIQTEIHQRFIIMIFFEYIGILFCFVLFFLFIDRKRSLAQCADTQRSFETLYEQEELVLDNLQQRMETLEPITTDTNKLRLVGKTVAVNSFCYHGRICSILVLLFISDSFLGSLQ